MRLRTASILAALALAFASAGTAGEGGGRARVDGVVKDDKGAPVAGCTIKLRWGRSGHGGPDGKTDDKGKWAIGGLASGAWDVDFEAPGYKTKQIQVSLSESGRN